jgi:hypothetical protein
MNVKEFSKYQEDIVLQHDIYGLIVGEKIGSGLFRDVYEYVDRKDLVVKIAKDTRGNICNSIEFQVWSEVMYFKNELEEIKNWFAPVESISTNCCVLIMKRTQEKPNKKRPDLLPKLLVDTHYDNFGWIGDKFVCHDYGSQPFFKDLTVNQLKKLIKK